MAPPPTHTGDGPDRETAPAASAACSRRRFLSGLAGGTAGLAGARTGTLRGAATAAPGAVDGMDPTLVPADPDAGFNYPYYLYAPDRDVNDARPLLVEPNNTGGATDDFAAHKEVAKLLLEDWPMEVSDALGVPLLVPVFPRPRTTPVDVTHYVHALDRDTMQLTSGDLARVDLQLRAMVDHAKQQLADDSYAVADRIAMDGFSATGNFVNRFTALHPDLVTSVTAGAVNGTAILPRTKAKGHTLNYQIGVADLQALTGTPFDRDRWVEVDQYVYMGSEDENDTIPDEATTNDAWSESQRAVALDVYGEDMVADRMPYCESVYDDAGASAEFVIYDGLGHEVASEMVSDVIDFHDEHMMDGATVESTPTPSTATPAGDGTDEPDGAGDGGSDGAADDDSDGGGGPGFGLVGGLAGLAGAYALHRHRSTDGRG